jgi:hypothetical protein
LRRRSREEREKFVENRVARFSLGHATYQNGEKNMPNTHKIYQISTKIYQIAVK